MAVVGQIGRTHGIRGQVYVHPDTDFLEDRFHVGAELWLGRGAEDCKTVTLAAVRFYQGRPVIAIDGVVDMNAAVRLAGAQLRVPKEALAILPEGTYYRHDLVGCQVETVEGTTVGEVSAVEGAGSESRLMIQVPGGEVLIPLVPSICTTIDPANRRIVITPPVGLLELNVKS